MRTFLTVLGIGLMLLGIIALTGCGCFIERERAYAPTIHSVVLENSTAMNYPAMVGNTLTCRAHVSTHYGSADSIAAFVIGSTTRAVPMVNEVASLTITPDMVGMQTSAYCVVSSHVRDSRTKVKRSNDIQVYPATYGYRLPCGTPAQQYYNPCPSTQLGVYVGPGQVSVNYRRN